VSLHVKEKKTRNCATPFGFFHLFIMWNWFTRAIWTSRCEISQEKFHNDDDDDVDAERVKGSLKRYEVEEGGYFTFLRDAYISFIESKEDNSSICKISSSNGGIFAKMEITVESDIKFDSSRHSILWKSVSFDREVNSFEFVFDSRDSEKRFKTQLALLFCYQSEIKVDETNNSSSSHKEDFSRNKHLISG
jgi:hypothetical protein